MQWLNTVPGFSKLVNLDVRSRRDIYVELKHHNLFLAAVVTVAADPRPSMLNRS